MKVGAVGYNYVHEEDFIMDCPEGSGCPLLLLIKEPSVFVVGDREYDVPKNSFVLFTSNMPHSYRAKYKVYTDDWVYFSMSAADEDRLKSSGVPFNEIITLGNIEELSHTVRAISFEHYSIEEGHELIEEHLFEILMIRLGRAVRRSSLTDVSHLDKVSALLKIRNMIYAVPNEILDVNKLSEMAGMSRSGFQHLYKKVFGISVSADVINARMKLARELLVSANMSIRETAQKCGYADEYSFMKRFRKYYGITPTQMKEKLT